jgi:hypothetical protein
LARTYAKPKGWLEFPRTPEERGRWGAERCQPDWLVYLPSKGKPCSRIGGDLVTDCLPQLLSFINDNDELEQKINP